MSEKISWDVKTGWEFPSKPIIPFITGDGVGVDITPVMCRVIDEAVRKAYGSNRQISWLEVFAGEQAVSRGDPSGLPEATLNAIREYRVAIKGPLTTPVGGGFRSLNVALRQILDLYVCLRPVRYYEGTPSPVRHPEDVDMVIFRENSEDIYAGIEYVAGSKEAVGLIEHLQSLGVKNITHPQSTGIGIKPVSLQGSERLIRDAIDYAFNQGRDSVTLVHKGNIMKFTEGAFKDWGYALAKREFDGQLLDGGPWLVCKHPKTGAEVVIKDVIADAFLQQILTRPKEYSVIATLNLNGDYISDALAAQVGGIGIAPGANLGEGLALFEATHGTAPKYAGQDKVNPGSLILSGEMMLRHLGWQAAADYVVSGMSGAIAAKTVTYDFARLMEGVTPISCSDFGEAVIAHMSS